MSRIMYVEMTRAVNAKRRVSKKDKDEIDTKRKRVQTDICFETKGHWL